MEDIDYKLEAEYREEENDFRIKDFNSDIYLEGENLEKIVGLSDQIVVDQDALEQVVEWVRDDPALDASPEDASILYALKHLADATGLHFDHYQMTKNDDEAEA